uniref:Uncharacterized protein n=1 Tax=viral metagenome TaxID=1070528 RepID=A0A6C0DNR5_9ZZZZ
MENTKLLRHKVTDKSLRASLRTSLRVQSTCFFLFAKIKQKEKLNSKSTRFLKENPTLNNDDRIPNL